MTLVIQRAEHRDTQALHAKLDELLHAQGTASDKITNIDKKDAEEIEMHRKVERANDWRLSIDHRRFVPARRSNIQLEMLAARKLGLAASGHCDPCPG